MHRVALHAVLALVVALAGCSGAQAPASTTTQPSTTGTPTTAATTGTATTPPTTTSTPTVEPLAPGVTRAGVVNASALVDAHVAALNASGYEHWIRVTTTMTAPEMNETFTSSVTKRVRATPGLSSYRLRSVHVEGDGDARRRTARVEWSNGTVRLLRVESRNRTAYERLDPVDAGGRFEREVRLTSRLVLREFLRRGDYRVAAVTAANGSTRVRLVADGAPAANVTAFSATVVVDAAGRIRRLNATMTAQVAGDRTMTTTVEYRLVRLGVERVERPAWADEALAATSEAA